jgi:hypothetical protein
MTIEHQGLFEELHRRECDGIEVSLLWHREDGTLTVFVFDAKTNETLELGVERMTALDVFRHPFAYAA